MAAQHDEKKKLYQRISRANPHTILERMRVHGFWPSDRGFPPDPPDEAAERAKLEKELQKLHETAFQGGADAVDKALRAERIRRWEQSKQKRKERKKLRLVQAAERRVAWAKEKQGLLVHAGIGVSAGLQDKTSDVEELDAVGLPLLHDAGDIVKAMGIGLSELRFLTYHRQGAALVHYARFTIPKKLGGVRHISAPKPKLARAQRWVLENVLMKLKPSEQAHGFVCARSIVTNAAPHVGKKVVVNLDLKDFFPTFTFGRAKGIFRSFGYSEHVATVFALLCTEPPRVEVDLDGKHYWVALGARVLPQGACTSPALTNLACRRLDRRLAGLARKHGFAYTRYADDLTFSGDHDAAVGRLLRSARSILKDEGLTEHPTKTGIMRRGRRQEVTGVVVNERPAIARDEVREIRAILHNAGKTGLEAQNRDGHPDFRAHLRGRIAYVMMVNHAQGKKLLESFTALGS